MDTTRLSTTEFVQRGVAIWRDYQCVLPDTVAEALPQEKVQLTQPDGDATTTLMHYKRWPVEGDGETDRVTVSL